VLWLKGNSIVAAFEVESTTSVYSGLLRMADLITMQPNINIPLYIVAPDERRNKVIQEVNGFCFRYPRQNWADWRTRRCWSQSLLWCSSRGSRSTV
jgi:hypothetical protein